MYLFARSRGLQPSEFWDMTLPEWFLEFHEARETTPGQFAGKLTRRDVRHLQALIEDDE
jgi:hypothetical protein